MTVIFNRDDVPSHLFSIPELDFSEDILTERISGSWMRVGAWTIRPHRDERGVENVVSRQSMLLAPGRFADIFDKLESIGNVIHNLGKPGGYTRQAGDQSQYSYAPFHRFEFPFNSVTGEPLVFVHSAIPGVELFINPDLELFFGLEEKVRGCGIWSDPRRGVEVLRRRVIEQGNLSIVEIRTDYLLKYLQARQISLLVGHYRHLYLYDPSPINFETFVTGDVEVGSTDQGTKVIVQNHKGGQALVVESPFLLRRLHLWFEVKPPKIDIDDPWAEEPSFDPYTFTLPTRVGPVAPARWQHFRKTEGRSFEGAVCDFTSPVYFRQEVLSKYEGASGFDVSDNGSVSCRHYWGLVRSTARGGNELLTTYIGDFAEGVPFEEWPHWKQYAVEPPSLETVDALREEQTVPDGVNSLVQALYRLNAAFAGFANSIGVAKPEPPWQGSLDSLAARQLKWVYPADADDDEFLKRATLVSTLVIDALAPRSLRELLNAVGEDLHLNDGSQGQSLGSRNLLQRVTLIAILVQDFQPTFGEIPTLVRRAEGTVPSASAADLQDELTRSYRRVRDEFAPLAFLYDLRTHGGLVHPPNRAAAATAATQLGLPKENWHRADYLRLLSLVTSSITKVSEHLDAAAR